MDKNLGLGVLRTAYVLLISDCLSSIQRHLMHFSDVKVSKGNSSQPLWESMVHRGEYRLLRKIMALWVFTGLGVGPFSALFEYQLVYWKPLVLGQNWSNFGLFWACLQRTCGGSHTHQANIGSCMTLVWPPGMTLLRLMIFYPLSTKPIHISPYSHQ